MRFQCRNNDRRGTRSRAIAHDEGQDGSGAHELDSIGFTALVSDLCKLLPLIAIVSPEFLSLGSLQQDKLVSMEGEEGMDYPRATSWAFVISNAHSTRASIMAKSLY